MLKFEAISFSCGKATQSINTKKQWSTVADDKEHEGDKKQQHGGKWVAKFVLEDIWHCGIGGTLKQWQTVAYHKKGQKKWRSDKEAK